jgi:uncharacterized protein
MRSRIDFVDDIAAVSTEQNRLDVACFVGLVPVAARWGGDLPPHLAPALRALGWLGPAVGRSPADLAGLLHVPVPVESWAEFEQLFDWRDQRIDGDAGSPLLPTYLGAAVRSFFAQGGRRCFVVRVGDPPALRAPRADRLQAARQLLPEGAAASPHERAAWRGIAHLHELAEVSLLCLPDLPWLVAQQLPDDVVPEPPPAPGRRFVECSEPPPPLPPSETRAPVAAPRCLDEDGYRDWAARVHQAARFLAAHRKDVQLVAAVPLPGPEMEAARDLLGAFVRWGLCEPAELAGGLGLSTAFVQLAYPWWSWDGSAGMPGAVEPPDGLLAGVLARNTLLQGAFRSAARQPLYHARAVSPELRPAERLRPHPLRRPAEPAVRGLEERMSLIGRGSDGFQLLSDVTMADDEAYRPASVNRLTSVLVRALAHAGEPLVFESSGETLWAALRDRLRNVGGALFRRGALRGRSADEAFRVRCDRSTMSELDIERGRLVAEVVFQPQAPLDSIRVTLALDESQRVSVLRGTPA